MAMPGETPSPFSLVIGPGLLSIVIIYSSENVAQVGNLRYVFIVSGRGAI
jgi:hypothetical protein